VKGNDTDLALPTVQGVREAAERLRPHLAPTPLLVSETLSQAYGCEVSLKLEMVSPIGSFKLRGALNCILAQERATEIIVASSTGNHGQGVAYAARLLGRRCRIFLPDNPNPVKLNKIRMFGAEVSIGGADHDQAKVLAQEFCRHVDALFVDDGENRLVIEGAATVGLEIGTAQRVDAIFAPVGGGVLAAGTALGVKIEQPGVRVIGVAPAQAPSMYESFIAKRAVPRPIRTEVESLAQGVPAQLALETMLRHLDDVIPATDDELFRGAKTLALAAQVLVEPGAAAGLVGLSHYRSRLSERARVALVLSGANLDSRNFERLVASTVLEFPAKA
jgi:threonine dehydratase